MFEDGVNRHEDMVALGSQRLRWRLGHARIGLQGFVKHLNLPPFFVGRGDDVIVAREVTGRCQGSCRKKFDAQAASFSV